MIAKLYNKVNSMSQDKFNHMMNVIVATILVVVIIYAFIRGINIYNTR